ncbi:hypothetical protein JCM5350_007928 [Sporobolomyces pararoseus]
MGRPKCDFCQQTVLNKALIDDHRTKECPRPLEVAYPAHQALKFTLIRQTSTSEFLLPCKCRQKYAPLGSVRYHLRNCEHPPLFPPPLPDDSSYHHVEYPDDLTLPPIVSARPLPDKNRKVDPIPPPAKKARLEDSAGDQGGGAVAGGSAAAEAEQDQEMREAEAVDDARDGEPEDEDEEQNIIQPPNEQQVAIHNLLHQQLTDQEKRQARKDQETEAAGFDDEEPEERDEPEQGEDGEGAVTEVVHEDPVDGAELPDHLLYPPTLYSYFFAVDKRTHFIVCTKCRIGVPFSALYDHHKRHQSGTNLGKAALTKIETEIAEIGDITDDGKRYLTPSSLPLPVIPSINHKTGHFCTTCHLASPNRRVINNHQGPQGVQEHHGISEGLIQTVYSEPKSVNWVLVELPHQVRSRERDQDPVYGPLRMEANKLAKRLADSAKNVGMAQEYPWHVRFLEFDLVITLKDPPPATSILPREARDLLTLPPLSSPDPLRSLRPAVRSFLNTLNNDVSNAAYEFRLAVCQDKRQVGRLVEEKTITTYSLRVSQLVVYLWRATESEELMEREGLNIRDWSEVVTIVKEIKTKLLNDPPKLNALFLRLFSLLPFIIQPDSPTRNPLFRCFVYSLVSESQRRNVFIKPNDSTRAFVPLLWTFQVCAALSTTRQRTQADPPLDLVARDQLLTRLRLPWGAQSQTVLGQVSRCYGPLRQAADSQQGANIQWLDPPYNTRLQVRGKHFDFTEISKTMDKTLLRLEELLDHDLSPDQLIPTFDLLKVSDNWASPTGFLSELGELNSNNKFLLEQATTPGTLLSKIFSFDVYGNTHLNHLEAQKFISLCEEFELKMMLLTHITAGLPPRSATILTTYLVETGLTKRGVYLHGRHIALLAEYSKAAKLNPKPSLRFLTARQSLAFVRYQVFVRPFYALVFSLMYKPGPNAPPESVENYHRLMNRFPRDLFVFDTRPLTPERYPVVLGRLLKSNGINAGQSEVRQAFNALVDRKVLQLSISDPANEQLEGYGVGQYHPATLQQSGHSARMAQQHYAVEQHAGIGISNVHLTQTFYYTCSQYHPLVYESLTKDEQWVEDWGPKKSPEELEAVAEREEMKKNVIELDRKVTGLGSQLENIASLLNQVISSGGDGNLVRGGNSVGGENSVVVRRGGGVVAGQASLVGGGVVAGQASVAGAGEGEVSGGAGNVRAGETVGQLETLIGQLSAQLDRFAIAQTQTTVPPLINPFIRRTYTTVYGSEPELTTVATPDNLLPLLRTSLRNAEATFKPGQLQAVSLSRHFKTSILVLPTGGGKTSIFALPALDNLQRHKEDSTLDLEITVVIVPTIALLRDLDQRLTRMGLQTIVARHGTDLASYIDGSLAVVLAVSNVAASEYFRTVLATIKSSGRLGGIYVDECHVPLVDHYWRYETVLVRQVASFSPRHLVLLTASLPVDEQQNLLQYYDLEEAAIYRAPTSRPELQFSILRLSLEQQTQKVTEILSQIDSRNVANPSSSLHKVLVYTNTVKEAETLTSRFQKAGIKAGFYHSQPVGGRGKRVPVAAGNVVDAREAEDERLRTEKEGIDNRQIATMKEFNEGSTTVLVCTKAIAHGVDTVGVQTVFFHGLSCRFAPGSRDRAFTSIIDIYQQLGRAGRNGDKAKVYFCVEPLEEAPALTADQLDQLSPDFRHLHELLYSPRCITSLFSRIFDGESNTTTCHPFAPCSNCTDSQRVDPAVRLEFENRIDYLGSKTLSPFDYPVAQDRRRRDFVQALHRFLGPLSLEERQADVDQKYFVRTHPCTSCYKWVAIQLLLHPSSHISLPLPIFPDEFDYSTELHDVSTCRCLKSSRGKEVCTNCSSRHPPVPCSAPTLSLLLSKSGTKTTCFKCGLRHSNQGIEFQEKEDFKHDGECSAGIGNFFYALAISLYYNIEKSNNLIDLSTLSSIDPRLGASELASISDFASYLATRDDDLSVINAVPFVLSLFRLSRRNSAGTWEAIPDVTLRSVISSVEQSLSSLPPSDSNVSKPFQVFRPQP